MEFKPCIVLCDCLLSIGFHYFSAVTHAAMDSQEHKITVGTICIPDCIPMALSSLAPTVLIATHIAYARSGAPLATVEQVTTALQMIGQCVTWMSLQIQAPSSQLSNNLQT